MPRISPVKFSNLAVLVGQAVWLPAFGADCESLKSLALANTQIEEAVNIRPMPVEELPGVKTAPSVSRRHGHCRVAATLRPTSDSEIKIQVWMPTEQWNGALQSLGNGAWAGNFSYAAMQAAVERDYATAMTDTGHAGNNADFITGHPEKVIDFAYRGVHEMTVAAKMIVSAYYGKPPAHSYFNGCSTGGRQALAEAQRYPEDYDGIIAGAPANYPTRLQGQQVWMNTVVHKEEGSYIPPEKYKTVHDAVLKACDALDGVKDGVLEDPTKCHFDPKELACKGADEPRCLTPPQVEAARKVYEGPKPQFPGLEPGSETGWGGLLGPKPMSLAEETYKYLVFKDPNWNYMTFDPARDMARGEKEAGALMNSVDPNLKPLFSRGGKLLMYHGWADPGITPLNSVNYYKSVVEKSGGDAIRLFMVPGMGHCRGGDGTDTFDAVKALSEWVEKGKAPERIEASHVTREGRVTRTRPLCPYPQVAKYKGSGSTDDSANFSCVQ